MAFMKKAKAYAKRQGKRALRFAKKRYVKKGQLNLRKITQDVNMLKHLVNIEKKRIDVNITGSSVAQLFGAGVSGQYAAIISPLPGQGTGQGQRVGNSIKAVSGVFDMKVSQQGSTVNNLRVKMWIVCRPDNSTNYSAATSIAQFLEANPFSGVNDYYSNRDPEYFRAFKVITSRVVTLKQDAITSGQSIVQVKIPLKFNHHMKFNADASTTTTTNQFYVFLTASDGDSSTGTGANIIWNMRWYYTDN